MMTSINLVLAAGKIVCIFVDNVWWINLGGMKNLAILRQKRILKEICQIWYWQILSAAVSTLVQSKYINRIYFGVFIDF